MKLVHAGYMRVATLLGHVIEFEPGVPQDVPNVVVADCLGKGAVPVDEAEEAPVAIPANAATDHERLVVIFKQLIADARKEDFRQDETPKASVVKKLFGRDITDDERTAAWAAATAKAE